MRILLTGGAGFIGSHLSERLLRDGHELIIADDLNDFYSPAVKRANLEAIHRVGPAMFHQADICDEEKMFAIGRENKPDAIVHLAARAGVRPSLEHPLLYERVNVRGTLVLLEMARQLRIAKFVFASSSSIYGIADRVPFREDAALSLPISPYAATKIAGEKLCYTYSHLYSIPTICLRLFTVYGPRQRPDLAIHKFARLITHDRPIPVFGDGSSGRDYTYYSDVVDGIVAALHYECRFDILNLGNSHPVSLNDMISTLESYLGRKAKVECLPDQPGDVPITFADIAKARQVLGYTPRVPFDQGIESFVAWFSRNEMTTS